MLVALLAVSLPLPREIKPRATLLPASSFSPPLTAMEALALFDFVAESTSELPLTKGMLVNILDMSDPNWYKAEVNGRKGYVPKEYVELRPNEYVLSLIPCTPYALADQCALHCPSETPNRALAHRLHKQMLTSWFYGKISRISAEQHLLQRGSPGTFLVRDSESDPGMLNRALALCDVCACAL